MTWGLIKGHTVLKDPIQKGTGCGERSRSPDIILEPDPLALQIGHSRLPATFVIVGQGYLDDAEIFRALAMAQGAPMNGMNLGRSGLAAKVIGFLLARGIGWFHLCCFWLWSAPMNKYGRYGVPVPWDAIKTLWCTGEKSCREIGEIFGVIPNTISTRAKREGWSKLKDRVMSHADPQLDEHSDSAKAEPVLRNPQNGMISSIGVGHGFAPSPLGDEEIVRRAVTLSGSDHFRTRVLAVNEKALKILEANEPTNVGEVDRFAEALTKVERIGARTYGYDRESERPAINISVLSSGNEYE